MGVWLNSMVIAKHRKDTNMHLFITQSITFHHNQCLSLLIKVTDLVKYYTRAELEGMIVYGVPSRHSELKWYLYITC